MFDGEFLKSIFKNEYLRDSIRCLDSEFHLFIKECFITDLVLKYNNSGVNNWFYSKDIIPVYYEILKENERYLAKNIVDLNHSTGQEKYRIINRNIFSSNSKNKDGLQNRSEVDFLKEHKSIGYRLTDKIVLQAHKNGIIRRMYFMETFPYLFNLRKLLLSNEKIRCSCGNEKDILIKIKKNDSALPLPISKHIEFKCIHCFFDGEQEEFKYIFKGEKKDGYS